MKSILFILYNLIIITICSSSHGATIATVTSPNQSFKLELLLENSQLFYQVKKDQTILISKSRLGMITSTNDFTTNLTFEASTTRSVNETYTLPSGKKSQYLNNYNELNVSLFNGANLNVIFRVFDDGVAFRYELPGSGKVTVLSELSEFVIAGFKNSWAQKYYKDYSMFYESDLLQENICNKSFSALTLIKSENQNYFLITEAANNGDYSVSQLKADAQTGTFYFDKIGAVNATLPLSTPWRVAITGSLPVILESVMIQNLNPNTSITDISWIKPGKVAWAWGGEDANSRVDFSTIKKYIDYAAETNKEYFLLDEGWNNPLSDYNLKQVIDYASIKSVGVFIWINSQCFNKEGADIKSILSEWSFAGVKGIKVDFWDDDSQLTMMKYDELIQTAADMKMLVNLHGCTKPSGKEKTWPNLLTSEAVSGGTQTLFSEFTLPASHNINLTMTRNVIGSMDYAPVDYATKSGKVKQTTTWAHQLALCVAFESGLLHFADSPDNYRYQMSESLFKTLPVTWDDIKCIEALPDSYSTMARRKGEDWYVASLCDSARILNLKLLFLNDGSNYSAYIYKDGSCKSDIAFEYKQNLTKDSILSIPLLATGGAVIRFTTSTDYQKPDLIRYEAESDLNTTKFLSKKTDPDNMCSEGRFVTNIGRGRSLIFNKISAYHSGRYALRIFYMAENACHAFVKENASSGIDYSFDSTGGATGENLAFKTVFVDLLAGTNNSIEIGNDSEYAPNIDRITIEPVDKSDVVGIDDSVHPVQNYKIYSFDNSIILHTEAEAKFVILDLLGRKIQIGVLKSDKVINMKCPGVYVVQLQYRNSCISQKVIVK